MTFPPSGTRGKCVARRDLVLWRNSWPEPEVVFTNGVFDLLHPGHVHVLEAARLEGELLIVGINTDASVRRLKGPERPVWSLDIRMRMVAALEAVDYVVPFDEPTPENLIRALQPQVLVKGGDYTADTIVGHALVERVVVIPRLPDWSTTTLIGRLHGLGEA